VSATHDPVLEWGVQQALVPGQWTTVAAGLPEATAKAFLRGAVEGMLDGDWRIVDRPAAGPWRTPETATRLQRQPDTQRPAWSS